MLADTDADVVLLQESVPNKCHLSVFARPPPCVIGCQVWLVVHCAVLSQLLRNGKFWCRRAVHDSDFSREIEAISRTIDSAR
jgi:hypothetical protein